MRALFALFIRSVRQDTRAKLPPILRAALVLILLLIIISNQREFGRFADQGLTLLISVVVLNLAFLGVAAVSIFPSAIAEEKEDETLPLLRMTNLSPVAILLGKFAPQFLTGVLLLAVQVPFTLIARAMGGITVEQVLQAYAILFATLFFLCCLALLCSVLCRTIVRAGFLTGGIAVVVYLVLPLLITPIMRNLGPNFMPRTAAEYFARAVLDFHPLWNVFQVLDPFRGASFRPEAIWWNVGAGGLCFVFAWMLFDRYGMQMAETVPRPAGANSKAGGGSRRKLRVSRVWERCLAWKDFHFMVGGWRGFFIRILFAAILLGLIVGYSRWYVPRYDSFSRYWTRISDRAIAFGIGAGVLDLLLIASRLFGQERRGLTLSSLMSLPWKPQRLFWQKVLGCLPALIPWLLMIAIGLAMKVGWFRTWGWARNGHWDLEDLAPIFYLGSQFLCLLVLTAYFSLIIRRGALPAAIAAAVVWNIILAMVLDHSNRSEGNALLFFFGVLTWITGVFLYAGVLRRMQAAAAAD